MEDFSLILTVNQRLCVELHRHFQQLKMKQQQLCWNTPNIMPFNTWLNSIWEHYSLDDHNILSNWQELCLWQNIIKNDPSLSLIQSDTTATQAQQAWHILQQWHIPLAKIEYEPNPETQKFYSWAIQFEKLCLQKKLVPQSSIAIKIKTLLQQQTIPLPKKIMLAGFDLLPPSINSLIETLQKQVSFETLTMDNDQAELKRYQFADEEDEIQNIARWAKTELTLNPKAQLACIYPRLSEQRTTIERIFTETFYFDKTSASKQAEQAPIFNISAALPLTHYPIIQAAYQILNLNQSSLGIEQLSYLLQSPYLTQDQAEINLGAQIDFQLRELNEVKLTLADIVTAINQTKLEPATNAWQARWGQLQTTLSQLPKQKKPAEWVEIFRLILKSIGWPGARTLNSLEFQLCQKLNKCIEEFSSLNLIYNQLSFKEAAKLFTKQLNQTTFQPEGSVAPIQILGILESSGLYFDKIWLANLDDEQWPPAHNPNPFLPIQLQRDYKTPHSCAERELEYCQITLQRLFKSAEGVYVSSYLMSGDQKKQPSRLISSIEPGKLATLEPSGKTSLLERYPSFDVIHALLDESGPTILPMSPIKGGSQILKLQAMCPFRAFGQIRLAAQTINQPRLGIRPDQKGILVHHILENLWAQLKDSHTLHATAEHTLHQIIINQVKKSLQQIDIKSKNKTNKLFLTIEEKRLISLVTNWLNYEKTRDPFSVIALEQSSEIKLRDLAIRIRVDRIDRLVDGRTLIIDYKTSPTTTSSWLGESLQEPQLPLYSTFQATDGLAFGQLHSSGLRLKGFINDEHIDIGHQDLTVSSKIKAAKPTSWNQLTANWQHTLEELSYSFSQGLAKRAPLTLSSCQTCQLQQLCRIFEA